MSYPQKLCSVPAFRLDEARKLDLPGITHAALDDLAQALDGGLDKRRPRPFYREIRGKRLREQL